MTLQNLFLVGLFNAASLRQYRLDWSFVNLLLHNYWLGVLQSAYCRRLWTPDGMPRHCRHERYGTWMLGLIVDGLLYWMPINNLTHKWS